MRIIVSQCHCGSKPVLKRDDSYGHGESYMTLWVECPDCGCRSRSVGNYSGFEMEKTVIKAFDNWNRMFQYQNESAVKKMNKEYNMKHRYDIIENYNGLFDKRSILAKTDNLFTAVRLVEYLKKVEEENPCYSFDFQKIVSDIDRKLDWYPGESFDSFGEVIDCMNYKEFLVKKEILNGNSIT